MPSLTSFVMVSVLIFVVVMVAGQILGISIRNNGDEQQESCSRRCGVHNISHPFRLKDSPEECGDKRYNLLCEDNNQLILYYEFEEYHGKYYVQSINYNNFTIRLLDFNLASSNNSIPPYYSLGLYNFSSNFITSPYLAFNGYENYTHYILTKSMLYVSCKNPSEYIDKGGNCLNTSSYSKYENSFYVGGYQKTLSDLGLGDECHMKSMYLTSWPLEDGNNISCTDMRRMVFYGFELSWLNSLCNDGLYAQSNQYNQHLCIDPGLPQTLTLLYG